MPEEITQVLWWASFVALVALVILPLPFVVAGYISGKDTRPRLVKFEETGNALFMAVGLLGFYGFLSGSSIGNPVLWFTWLGLAAVWSLAALVWSPKLVYARKLLGARRANILAVVSTLLFLPMFAAVYFYAAQA